MILKDSLLVIHLSGLNSQTVDLLINIGIRYEQALASLLGFLLI